MPDMSFSDFLQLISALLVVAAVSYGLIKGISFVLSTKERQREEYLKSFDTVVANLSSSNPLSQLSAAVLLRRYFEKEQQRKYINLRTEAVNVISSLLRVLPVGIFQKTVGEGLTYAVDLTGADLQKTNLQDVCLGRKEADYESRLKLDKADCFLADFSYALIQNVNGKETVFYNAVFFNASIKNCDFSRANFCGADFRGARFANVVLDGADFSGAVNVPQEIESKLENGKVKSKTGAITAKPEKKKGTVFFSMPGSLDKQEEALTQAYRKVLESLKYEVIYYTQDDYPAAGQITWIREKIEKSSAMIAFGFKQINIMQGVLRPGTPKETKIQDKWLQTPWNEIEVGMALMRGLPILLVKEDGIDSGIFDGNLSESFVATISASFDSRDIESNLDFLRWEKEIGAKEK